MPTLDYRSFSSKDPSKVPRPSTIAFYLFVTEIVVVGISIRLEYFSAPDAGHFIAKPPAVVALFSGVAVITMCIWGIIKSPSSRICWGIFAAQIGLFSLPLVIRR